MNQPTPSAEAALTVDGTGLLCVTLLLRRRAQVVRLPPRRKTDGGRFRRRAATPLCEP